MQNQVHATGQDPRARHAFRNTARAVGVTYLAGMVLGLGGSVIIEAILGAPDRLSSVAASSALLAFGAVLWLVTVAGDAAHGILMFPVLKPHGERMAMAYFGARIMDATVVAVMALIIVAQIPLSLAYKAAGSSDTASLEALSGVLDGAQLYAYEFGMVALGAAGLVLCSVLHRSHLLPRGLATWGLVGYAILLAGSLLQILGVELKSIHAIPGGLWEIFIGVWLIAKGFSSSPSELPQPKLATLVR